jgi:hypothetical protein
MASLAAKRLAAFESRARCSPDQVLTHVNNGWRYIAVHPFADDHELLSRLNWPPERCVSVDAYWECAGDVHFLQVHTDQSFRGPGLYYRWCGTDAWAANLVAVADRSPVLRVPFEAIMTKLVTALPALGRARDLTPLPEL